MSCQLRFTESDIWDLPFKIGDEVMYEHKKSYN